MATSFLKSYFGRGGSTPAVPDTKSAVRALPASWYTSVEMYELEKRAIFSRKWLLITHKARLPNNGDWLKYEVANFEFIICKDREGKINAFHNICRHRAFPVLDPEKGDSGNSSFFACKYHGWSYGLNGNLAKAPGYQDLEGFDKSKNDLLPIHVKVDARGFIWINMDAKETPEIAWSDDFDSLDTHERFDYYNFDDYEFDHVWEMKGDYNWKILADNYNECYHCKVAHPDIPTIADLNSYWVETQKSYIQHFGAQSQEQIDRGFRIAVTYYLPNASTNISPHFFMIQRFVPHSPTSATMRYEFFRNKHSSDEDFELISNMYKRIMSEDKYLCANAQKNVNAGVFVNGEMHPEMEQGPLFFQNNIRELLQEHHKKEQIADKEIWPARQTLPQTSPNPNVKADVNFCSAVDCCKNNKQPIAV
ncbi:cytochrome P450 oxidoreductase [Fusarium albosuccineum]|uniref:Choline monooxygenase, chloroplastic n=1 Tax=Fusarium albosuccineum TaxID=1237068 RepID=A0A8H4PAX6_9HYPO|nr:cytochrome P450 oxidoreductase [Fusarium albosuccineum]